MNRACIVLYCAQIETCILGSYLSAPRLLSHSTVTWGVRKSGSLREPRRNVARVTCTQSHRLSVCSESFLCSWSAFKTSEHRKKSFPEGEPNASWSETYAALLQQCRSSESICPTCNSEQWGLTQHGHTFGQHANAWRKVPCLILTYFNLNFGETLI